MGSTHSGGAQPQKAARVIPFGKYLLLHRIAVGGMAEVFLAKSFGIQGFEKIIAIKRILPTMAEDDDFIDMFVDEAKIAGHLSHAHIVPIYELGKIGESHYIAMEYVWGKDLLQIMNRFRRLRQRMPAMMAAYLGSKMCEALEYAHNKRDQKGDPLDLIHRDVSPQNILVSYDGAVKLIDFGIAKAASRTTQTQAGVLKGKFGYMSPEQVRGLPIDHRSDLFAVGTCMYEMLTSDRLFLGESDFSTLEKVRHADVAPPSDVVPDLPPELNKVIIKALARDPQDRYQSAADFQDALQEFLSKQRTPFTTSKLGGWMKTAFAEEQRAEKKALDSFAQMRRPSVRPAPIAPPPTRKKTLMGAPSPLGASPLGAPPSPEENPFESEATQVTASPFEEDIQEEATQIFFSANDLESLPSVDDDDEEPTVSLSASAVLDLENHPGAMPPPQLNPSAMPQFSAKPLQQPGFAAPIPVSSLPDGSFQKTLPPTHEGPFPKQRHLATQEMSRVEDGKGRGKLILLALAAAAMLLLGVLGAWAMFRGQPVGTIEVRTVPEVGGQVYVDGNVSGNAPLKVRGVQVGKRTVRIVADGYETINRTVDITENGTFYLEVPLTKSGELAANAATPKVEPKAQEKTLAELQAEKQAAEKAVADATAESEAEKAAANEKAEAEAAAAEAAAKAERAKARAAERAKSGKSGSTAPRMRPVKTKEPAEDPPPRMIRKIDASAVSMSSSSKGTGKLVINTIPWSRVTIDGKSAGKSTPFSTNLSAGRHKLLLTTSTGETHTAHVTVKAGETTRYKHRF